jgi:hypothetical protein
LEQAYTKPHGGIKFTEDYDTPRNHDSFPSDLMGDTVKFDFSPTEDDSSILDDL